METRRWETVSKVTTTFAAKLQQRSDKPTEIAKAGFEQKSRGQGLSVSTTGIKEADSGDKKPLELPLEFRIALGRYIYNHNVFYVKNVPDVQYKLVPSITNMVCWPRMRTSREKTRSSRHVRHMQYERLVRSTTTVDGPASVTTPRQ